MEEDGYPPSVEEYLSKFCHDIAMLRGMYRRRGYIGDIVDHHAMWAWIRGFGAVMQKAADESGDVNKCVATWIRHGIRNVERAPYDSWERGALITQTILIVLGAHGFWSEALHLHGVTIQVMQPVFTRWPNGVYPVWQWVQRGYQ